MISIKDRFYLGVIACMLLIILCMRMCRNTPAPCPAAGEVVKRDTTWLEHTDTTGWLRPQPTAIIPAQVLHDTIKIAGGTVIKYREVDTPAILRDYFVTRYYEDSTTTEYGQVWVTDSVTQNRISRRKWRTSFTIPIVTNTVQVPAPARWQLYAGFSLVGNKQTLLNGFGPQLLLKTKRDQLYGIGAMYTAGGQIFYNGTTYFKINFNKH